MSTQHNLFGVSERKPITVFNAPEPDFQIPPMATTTAVDVLLAKNAPVAIGVSGGKDSSATAAATCRMLDRIGHTGPRILIHAHLGRAEWSQSLEICQRLAHQLGIPLVVVKRERGDMVDRWLQRWDDNSTRYANLLLVKALLPWSTSSMRFCTGEMKLAIIARELIRLFPGQEIISVSGIRRQESKSRSEKPVSATNGMLTSKRANTSGMNWHPGIELTEEEVWAIHHLLGLPIHEAYSKYLMSRVSCAFCVLASNPDLTNATTCEANHALYGELVDLEIRSTFAFKENKWLADFAPHLLTENQLVGVEQAKLKALERRRIEAEIPAHLLFEEGWPKHMPTYSEAQILAHVRQVVSQLIDVPINYSQPESIMERFASLMAENQRKEAQKKVKEANPQPKKAPMVSYNLFNQPELVPIAC